MDVSTPGILGASSCHEPRAPVLYSRAATSMPVSRRSTLAPSTDTAILPPRTRLQLCEEAGPRALQLRLGHAGRQHGVPPRVPQPVDVCRLLLVAPFSAGRHVRIDPSVGLANPFLISHLLCHPCRAGTVFSTAVERSMQ